MKMETAKKRICVTIPRNEHQRLTHLAGETGRTAAGYLRWLLHRHFRELDEGSRNSI